MEDNVFFYISENILSYINTILRNKNEEIIKWTSTKKCYNNDLLLQEILPSNKKKLPQCKNLSDKERCMARLWKGGYGGRCHNVRKDYGLKTECEFCNVHQKEILSKGKLRYCRIDEISPFRLPKNPKEPYKRCIHISDNVTNWTYARSCSNRSRSCGHVRKSFRSLVVMTNAFQALDPSSNLGGCTFSVLSVLLLMLALKHVESRL